MVALKRDSINNEIEELSRDVSSTLEEKAARKNTIMQKLCRMVPGAAVGIGAMQDLNGRIATTPADIASVLKQHWSEVFKPKDVNNAALQIWMEELFIQDDQGCFITGLPERSSNKWVVRRKHVKCAINCAKNSMPGPDGIPAAAYKHLGDFAITIIHAATECLGTPEYGRLFGEAYQDRCPEGAHNFNASLLVCLPKKPTDNIPGIGDVYSGEDTRPLSLVNTENRIIASAARYCWEPLLGDNYVSNMQQGFIKGRSMMNNIIDVDYHAMTVSLASEKGAMIFRF